MAQTMSLYSFEDNQGNEEGTYTTTNFLEAKEYARRNKARIIEHVYEWSESVPVDRCDFTEPDEDAEDEKA